MGDQPVGLVCAAGAGWTVCQDDAFKMCYRHEPGTTKHSFKGRCILDARMVVRGSGKTPASGRHVQRIPSGFVADARTRETCRNTCRRRAQDVMALVREFDLAKTWNRFCEFAAVAVAAAAGPEPCGWAHQRPRSTRGTRANHTHTAWSRAYRAPPAMPSVRRRGQPHPAPAQLCRDGRLRRHVAALARAQHEHRDGGGGLRPARHARGLPHHAGAARRGKRASEVPFWLLFIALERTRRLRRVYQPWAHRARRVGSTIKNYVHRSAGGAGAAPAGHPRQHAAAHGAGLVRAARAAAAPGPCCCPGPGAGAAAPRARHR